MSILDEQREQNMEDYQSYKITLALKGKMTPSFEGAVRLINSRKKVLAEYPHGVGTRRRK